MDLLDLLSANEPNSTMSNPIVRLDNSHDAPRGVIREIPKVLLHTHIEGSIPPKTLALLCSRNHVRLPFDPFDHLAERFTLTGWSQFAESIRAVFTCFEEAQDFSDAVVGYAESLAASNVVYAEVHCSPWKHIRRGVPLRSIEVGLLEGISAAMEKYDVEMKFICDIVRDLDEDRDLLLNWASALPRTVCPAIGISGGFRSIPLIELQGFCEAAHAVGLRVVTHAGELSGADSVRTSISVLKTDRICHGVRALEDPRLAEELVERRIHLELCPTANRLMGIGEPEYRSIARLLELGADCSINTDDELFFETTLEAEYLNLILAGIIVPRDLLQLQVNAINASFMTDSKRASLLLRLNQAWTRLDLSCDSR